MQRYSRYCANRLSFCISSQKNEYTAIVFTWDLLIDSRNFVHSPCWFFKNGLYNLSQPFCSCRICANSAFPNFWSNNIWYIEFSWNKVVHSDSTGPTNGTWSEEVWEPLGCNVAMKITPPWPGQRFPHLQFSCPAFLHKSWSQHSIWRKIYKQN